MIPQRSEKSSARKQNYRKPVEVAASPRQVTNEFKRDPEQWFSMYPQGVAVTFEVILEADNNLEYVTLKLQTIADRVGVSVRTVIQYIKILIRGGLISKIQRYAGNRKNPRFRSSIFLVSDYFHNLCNRKKLRHLFKAFLYTPFILLTMSNGICHKIKTSLQLEKVNDYVNIFSLYNSFVLRRTKTSNSTVAQTQNTKMELKSYPNMHARSKLKESDNFAYSRQSMHTKTTESDNISRHKSWAIERKPIRSQKMYADGNRPQCIGGSVESEETRIRKRKSAEEQALRELEELGRRDDMPSVEWIMNHLKSTGWR